MIDSAMKIETRVVIGRYKVDFVYYEHRGYFVELARRHAHDNNN
jgi:hypothetical protein